MMAVTPNDHNAAAHNPVLRSNRAAVKRHKGIAVNAPNIYLAEGGVDVDISREASLQMEDSPDSPETASTVLVSLWQRNMVAIKAERFITWKKKHDTSVQLITHAKYQ